MEIAQPRSVCGQKFEEFAFRNLPQEGQVSGVSRGAFPFVVGACLYSHDQISLRLSEHDDVGCLEIGMVLEQAVSVDRLDMTFA